VSEEADPSSEVKKIPLKQQLGVVVKDRYWWILILYTFIFQLGLAFKNSSVAYYCNWVIGTYNDGYTMLLFNLVGGASLAIGAVIINPLAKKFSKQTLMIWGFVFYALGDLLCFIISYPGLVSMSSKGIFVVVLVGQFIKNAGAIPCVYIWMSLVADVLDHLEWKAGFRCDGITVGINSIFALFMPILGNAIINLLLGNYGYIVPVEGPSHSDGSEHDLADHLRWLRGRRRSDLVRHHRVSHALPQRRKESRSRASRDPGTE
jgi:GPH family glycoside/pentoside/hexuronide:cation symporter